MPEGAAVLLISFGGPEKPHDVMPFLERMAQGHKISHERLLEAARHYEAIGGASPVNEITRRQAGALREWLRVAGRPCPVYIGQRHWHPFLEDTLRQMARAGVKRAVGFITAAHRCGASADRYHNSVEEARRRIGDAAPRIDPVGPWFDHPLFIEAICERVKAVLTGASEPAWIFVAHSIPQAMAKASSYVEELQETARRVAEKFGVKDWSLAYSSRSGRPEEPWLGPTVCEAIRAQAKEGGRQDVRRPVAGSLETVKNVLLIPIGSVADHMEVLYDLDVEAKEEARKLNVGYRRAPTVGDHPSFIRMISEVVQARAAAAPLP